MPHDRTEPVTLSDPRAIRALAHPARLAVLDELRAGGELTATQCADLVGLSPSAMSYHLRALQRWGFVEPAPNARDGRERPWRATSPGGWRVDAGTSPVLAAATSAVVSSMLDRTRADILAWNEHEHAEPKAWQRVATVSNALRWLTPAEAGELLRHYEAALRKAEERTEANHPRGARRVRLGLIVAPSPKDAG